MQIRAAGASSLPYSMKVLLTATFYLVRFLLDRYKPKRVPKMSRLVMPRLGDEGTVSSCYHQVITLHLTCAWYTVACKNSNRLCVMSKFIVLCCLIWSVIRMPGRLQHRTPALQQVLCCCRGVGGFCIMKDQQIREKGQLCFFICFELRLCLLWFL